MPPLAIPFFGSGGVITLLRKISRKYRTVSLCRANLNDRIWGRSGEDPDGQREPQACWGRPGTRRFRRGGSVGTTRLPSEELSFRGRARLKIQGKCPAPAPRAAAVQARATRASLSNSVFVDVKTPAILSNSRRACEVSIYGPTGDCRQSSCGFRNFPIGASRQTWHKSVLKPSVTLQNARNVAAWASPRTLDDFGLLGFHAEGIFLALQTGEHSAVTVRDLVRLITSFDIADRMELA